MVSFPDDLPKGRLHGDLVQFLDIAQSTKKLCTIAMVQLDYLDVVLDSGHQMAFSMKLYRVDHWMGTRLFDWCACGTNIW